MRRSLLVFSHLPWDSRQQRPQQLMRRLGRYYRIVFVEPQVLAGSWGADFRTVTPDVTVVSLHASALDDLRHPTANALAMSNTLRALLRTQGIHDYGAWFYTPLALPLLERLAPRVVVYDCMDAQSAFLDAPPLLVEREGELLRRAQFVFTGGPSLQRAKSEFHPSVYCFPSSVDSPHFAKAALPRYVHRTGTPQLGYFGSIDERIDLSLIEAIADLRPDWQLHIAGPADSVRSDRLPHRANIRYAGPQPYESLPAYMRQWDICMIPYAINEATRYISSTKTLEYMAAGKPIVSTPIPDVVEAHDDLGRIAREPRDFVRQCELALAETRAQRRRREAAMAAVVARSSWDRTAAEMQQLLYNAWPVSQRWPLGAIERMTRTTGSAAAI